MSVWGTAWEGGHSPAGCQPNHVPSLVSLCPPAHPRVTGTFRKALFSSMFMITGGMAGKERKEMSSQCSQPALEPHPTLPGLSCNLPAQLEEGTLTHGRSCHANAGHHHLENGLLGCCCGLAQAVPILIRDRDPQLELSAGTEGVRGPQGTRVRASGHRTGTCLQGRLASSCTPPTGAAQ